MSDKKQKAAKPNKTETKIKVKIKAPTPEAAKTALKKIANKK